MQERKWFWYSLLGLSLIRLGLIGHFELSPDEAYYWTWSRHLDLAYYDQGPMLALVIKFFSSLTGAASEWSVRLGAVLLSFLTAWLFFQLIERLFQSSRIAWYAFLGLQANILFSGGALLMMHDSIMISAWIAALLCFYRATVENWKWGWILGAIALGFGGLAKYTMAIFVPGLLLFLLLAPGLRSWWKKPQLYLAGLLTVILVSPVIMWNASHSWASFGHISDLSGLQRSFQISLKSFGNFLIGQLGVMTPCLGGFCLMAPIWAWKQWRQKSAQSLSYLFLFCFSFPILLFFFILAFKTSVYANWPAPAYPAAIGILAAWAQTGLESVRARTIQKWLAATLGSAGILVVLAHVELIRHYLPVQGKALESLDRIRGWKQLGQAADDWRQKLSNTNHRTPFMAARRYQIASSLTFYMSKNPEVQLFTKDQPPKNQYRFWNHTEALSGQDVLFVYEDEWELEILQPYFRKLTVMPVFIATDGKRKIREIRFAYGDYFRSEPEKAVAQQTNRLRAAP